MCGIAGIVAAPGARVATDVLQRMTRTLSRRGPDDEGYYVEDACGLGHRRLSIIDLSGGRQPLSAADGRVQVIVNGEIYNFLELRERLEALGHRFATRSDSEVLAHGYAAWGDSVVAQLEGMFAFAVWDAERRRLLLGRDRLGQKPLYYAPHEGGLLFGSELKALLAHPTFDPPLSRRGLGAYLVHECYPEEVSVFDGVEKVRPGEIVAFEPDRARLFARTYWQPKYGDAVAPSPPSELLLEHLEERVLTAVERRLVADVPLGVFLSGGVDSSVVAAAMARLRPPSSVETFSIGFEEQSFDESPFARQVAEHLGTKHREQRLSPDAMQAVLPTIVDYMDEPLGDASIIPTHLLSAFTREHVTVALGGDGGDELFLGYPTFQAELLARHLEGTRGWLLGRATERVARRLPVGHGYFSWDFKVRRFALGLGFDAPHRHQRWMSSFLPESLPGVLAPLGFSDADQTWVDALLHCFVAPPGARDDFDRLTHQYLRLYLAGDVLVKVDRASMAHGLEVRSPFLDREVVELALSVDWREKLRRGRTKHLLKRLAEKWLPPEVVHRKKQGFAVPIAAWIRGPFRQWATDLLAKDRLTRQGVFEAATVQRLLGEHLDGRADHRKPLWTLLAFQSWYDRYGTAAARAAAEAAGGGAVR